MRGLLLGTTFIAAAVLSGCSESDPSSATLPGPVQPTVPPALSTFEGLAANPNTAMIASADSAVSSTVVIEEGTSDDGNIQVRIGTTTYDLDGSLNGGVALFTENSSQVSVEQIDQQSDAVLALIRTGAGAVDSPSGYTVLGTATSAADLANLIGSSGADATYTGEAHIIATLQGGFSDSAEGDLVLYVDFENSSFDGTMDLLSSTPGVRNFEISTVNATISNGQIQNGGLTADVRVLDGDTNDFPNGANQLGLDPMDSGAVGSFSGAFFGTDAMNVGGTFNFDGVEPDTFIPGVLPNVVVVQGGFLGTR